MWQIWMKLSESVCLSLTKVWSHLNLRWPPQLIDICQDKNSSSVSFTNMELKSDVVAAKIHPQYLLKA